jgi:hypothetical protein
MMLETSPPQCMACLARISCRQFCPTNKFVALLSTGSGAASHAHRGAVRDLVVVDASIGPSHTMYVPKWVSAAALALVASLARPAFTQSQSTYLEITREPSLPIVINTWAGPCFGNATQRAWETLAAGGSALDAVEQVQGHLLNVPQP